MGKTRKEWAKEALVIQNACNPSGVAHTLCRYYQENTFDSTSEKCDDPIAFMMIYKLADLALVMGTINDEQMFYRQFLRVKEEANCD